MYPLIFGSYATYPFIIALIAPIPIWFQVRAFRREGVPTRHIVFTLSLMLLAALLGGKLFSLASRGWPVPLGWVELTGGMRFSGVVFGTLLMLPLVQRLFLQPLRLARVADILAQTLVVAVCAGRLACFFAGCCTGAVGDSLLHVSFPPGSNAWYLHLQGGLIEHSSDWSQPVLLLPAMFMALSVAVLVFLLRFDARRSYDGQVFLLFLLLHELPKSLLEWLRVPTVPEQIAATILAGLIGLCALFYFYYSPPSLKFRTVMEQT